MILFTPEHKRSSKVNFSPQTQLSSSHVEHKCVKSRGRLRITGGGGIPQPPQNLRIVPLVCDTRSLVRRARRYRSCGPGEDRTGDRQRQSPLPGVCPGGRPQRGKTRLRGGSCCSCGSSDGRGTRSGTPTWALGSGTRGELHAQRTDTVTIRAMDPRRDRSRLRGPMADIHFL